MSKVTVFILEFYLAVTVFDGPSQIYHQLKAKIELNPY